ncbi:hypothetical protein [Sinorhizobium sp. BG8]|uniref:hypothetical protein n=1 Tax=Sinorhizobium sp. BG8 TaxID=2613773 RepID=UPI00193E54E4|nr:hypothetical protein [Sinorhizobium sp. BG8]QRM53348.1 hypothetical protein F3Y30_01275 [Sinorhizobium sp. BG8]
MTVLLRILGRLFRIALYGLALCVVLLLAAVAFVGFTDSGARMAMSYVEKLISTPERTVVLGDPSGLLTGRLRIGSAVLGDRKGTYAEVRDVAVDWSPLSLAFLEFKAQLVSAGSVSLLRLPEPVAEASASSSSGKPFSLPVEVRVGSVDMPKILIGESVLGREQELRLSGSGSAGANYVALKVALSEQARPDARVNADILFNPAGNELRLDADIAEPRGGILATLLRLPGEPAVGIRLKGEGPLSAWGGRLSAGLDGQEVLSLDGRHDLSTAGLHTISLHGGGAFEGLMPPQLRSLMAGTTAIDVVAAFEGTDLLRIEKGDISTGAFTLKASGTASVKGANDLDVALSGTTQPIDLRLPLSGGEARFVIDGATVSLTGPADASALDVAATVLSVEVPQGRVEDVRLSARSPAFDLAKRSGTVNVLAETGATAFNSEDVNRAIKGPAKIAATLAIAPEQILFEPVTIESTTLGGTITGRHDLWTGATDATFKLFALPAVLPENLSAKFGTTISAEGRVTASSEGAIDLQDFQLKSDALEAAGRVSLKGGVLDAALSGQVPEIDRFLPQAKGAASFDISAAGNLDAPQVKGAVRSAGVALAGRTLANLAIDIDGKADRSSPAGEVSVSGELDGQQINLRSSVTSSSGQISMPVVEATIGTNTVKGALALGADFMPDGTLQFAFPDVGLLASLAGQSATGDLAGTVTFARAEGRTGLVLNATGSNLARDNVTVTKPVIDVTVEDLRALAATGIIRADGVTAGENDLQGPVVEFNHQGDVTGFKVSGRYENAPLATEGSVSQLQGVTTVALSRLEATVKGYPLRLTEATSIAIRDGAVNFDHMTIDAGIAEAEVSGTFSASGESDLRAYLSRAGGPIDLKFPVDGKEASLAIESANLSMVGKMQSARLSIAAKLASAAFPQGSIANAELAVESASFNILEQSGQVTASVKVGETQFVNADLARVLPGPVTLDANLSVQPSLIGFDEVALASAGANAKASGSFAPRQASRTLPSS